MIKLFMTTTTLIPTVAFVMSSYYRGSDDTFEYAGKIFSGIKTVFHEMYFGVEQKLFPDIYSAINRVYNDLNHGSEYGIGFLAFGGAMFAGSGLVPSIAFSLGVSSLAKFFKENPNLIPKLNDVGQWIINISSGAWDVVKVVTQDIYSAIKTPLSDFSYNEANTLGFGIGAIVFASKFAAANMPIASFSAVGAGLVVKSFADWNLQENSNLSNISAIELFANHLNLLVNDYRYHDIFEKYKLEIFSWNKKNEKKFATNKEKLKSDYLEQIDSAVDGLDIKKAFCDLPHDDATDYHTILHYTRKFDELKKEEDEMVEGDKQSKTAGAKWFDQYYNNSIMGNDQQLICQLRQEISKTFGNKKISASVYENFCKHHDAEPVCADFVEDVLFPELV